MYKFELKESENMIHSKLFDIEHSRNKSDKSNPYLDGKLDGKIEAYREIDNLLLDAICHAENPW